MVTRWSLWGRLLLMVIFLSPEGVVAAFGPGAPVAAAADITVTVDASQVVGLSQYAAGLTHINNSLFGTNAGAIERATAVVAQSTVFQNSHLMAWGVADPWPDPNQSGPTNWASLDRRIQLTVQTGGIPIITLAEAPWWMKGARQADGTTKLIPTADGDFKPTRYAAGLTDYRGLTYPAGYVSPSPYAARVLDNQMDKWLQLVQATAERYMAPPYNVRYFQVWNELKGYNNPTVNHWDYDLSAGDAAGYNAQHGYTFMYNQVYTRLKEVARSLGIPEGEIKIGGPYVAFKTWASPNAGGYPATEPQLQNRPYGTFDQRDVDAIKYWLQHKVGAEFITWDGGTKNREGVDLVDPYAASERFADTVLWLRSLDPREYPGADTLPVAYAEWNAFPYGTVDPQQQNSVKTYAALRYIQAGGWLTLLWGGEARTAPHLDASLYTPTDQAEGGQALPWAGSLQALKRYFSAGTVLVKTAQSSPNIGVLASAAKTLLVNKTAASYVVAVNGVPVTLDPYQVVVIDTPGAAGVASPTASPTTAAPASATPTATPAPTQTAPPAPTATATPTETRTPPVGHMAIFKAWPLSGNP